jgi:hypothetical protein
MRWPADRVRRLLERMLGATTPAARSAAMQRRERVLARLRRLAPRHVRPPGHLITAGPPPPAPARLLHLLTEAGRPEKRCEFFAAPRTVGGSGSTGDERLARGLLTARTVEGVHRTRCGYDVRTRALVDAAVAPGPQDDPRVTPPSPGRRYWSRARRTRPARDR